ncbi:DNA/RNA-binding protein KIN17, putative [Hepatocystis sp. ex Piliocolobus tephrosceles]|nr:DNA/RNA-binding protein KIN17, putative [Hepatocystis sp. ex Piliocolobus tephrosceles]
MPRAEVGTPKWLANKMKAKGLQKLKWYCQMCEKQCRDENGFKCHRLSEAHQRQMQVFCQDANKFMDDYSYAFEKEFMRLMKTKYCRTRILANTVYTNLISDKTHIHMNATVWVTLTDFVLYLGQTGKCKIEQTERGWYLEYIDREKIEREKKYQEQKKIEYSIEEIKEKKINQAIEEAKKSGKFIQSEYTPLNRKQENEKIIISSMKIKKNSDVNDKNVTKPPIINAFSLINQVKTKKNESNNINQQVQNLQKSENMETTSHIENNNNNNKKKNNNPKKRPLNTLDLLIMENEEKKKKHKNNLLSKMDGKNSDNHNLLQENKNHANIRPTYDEVKQKSGLPFKIINDATKCDTTKVNTTKVNTTKADTIKADTIKADTNKADTNKNSKSYDNDIWICKNIYVNIIDKKHPYYSNKGVIISICDDKKNKCEILLSSNKKITVANQKQLQTVLPKIGKKVLILKGKYKEYRGELKNVSIDKECAVVAVFDKYSDKIITEEDVLFDYISKFYEK